MNSPESLLQQYFGHTEFRGGQHQAINAILAHRDVLAIMPTGAGKSVCYQLSALLLPGITLVLSPLISLMKDQVEALCQIGIPASYINSSVSTEEISQRFLDTINGKYKILYVAPERLLTDTFLRFSRNIKISLITVDEAHCVSQWGQDFRQSYLEIPQFIDSLRTRPICTAFTATATPHVEADITKLLKLQDPVVVKTGFDRKNLYFEVRKPKDSDKELISILEDNSDKSGIIYCATRKNVDNVCTMLTEKGFRAINYHAGLSPEERAQNQEDFLYDRSNIMVATNAFGMGIDKSNVSFVIHYNIPKDLESYYQEAGRAGRDGEKAQCILLYQKKDVRTQQFLIEKSRDTMEIEDEKERQSLIQKAQDRLAQMVFYTTGQECLRYRILHYFGENPPRQCGNCSVCLSQTKEIDCTQEAKMIISCVYRAIQNGYHLSRNMVIQTLVGSQSASIQKMGLNQLSTYGIMAKYSQRDVGDQIDVLLSQDLLALQSIFTTGGNSYQSLTLTAEAAHVLRDERTVTRRVVLPKESTLKIDIIPEDIDSILFEELCQLRKTLSTREGVPPYFIFSDATLRDMCRKLPKTMHELREVSGVGIVKASRYGKEFLGIIADYCYEKESNKANF